MTDPNPLQPGDPFRVGRFDLLGRIGAGGMGTVFLGRSPDRTLAAVKVISAGHVEDAAFRARFGREVTAARRARGRFVAPVIDADAGGPDPWMAVEYVPGPSLANAVARFGPLPETGVRLLGAALARTLADVHAAGVTHRDLKPGNVMLLRDGPRIIDFGVARAADMTTITHAGELVGSPGFIAPEQVEQTHEVGAAADVFALGALICFAATGSGPFGTGQAATLVYRAVHHEPQLDLVPEQLRDLVAECLAKDPAIRPSALDVAARLLRPDADLDEHLRADWLGSQLTAELAARAARATELAELPPSAPTQIGQERPRAGGAVGPPTPPPRRGSSRLLVAGVAVLALMLAAAGVGYAVQPGALTATGERTVDTSASPSAESTGSPGPRSERPNVPLPPPSPPPSTKTPSTPTSTSPPTAQTRTSTTTARPPDAPTAQDPDKTPAPAQNQPAGDGTSCFNTAVLGGFDLQEGVTVAGGPNFTSANCRNIHIKLFRAKYRTYARSCLETPDGARITGCSPWILLSFPDTWDTLHVGVPANSRWQLQMYALGTESAGFYYTA